MTQSSGWNMDRTISVGLILAVLFQAGSFIWYGAKSPPQPRRRRLPITQAAQGQPPPSGGQRWLHKVAAPGRGPQRAQGGRGWADAVGGTGRLIFLSPGWPTEQRFAFF